MFLCEPAVQTIGTDVARDDQKIAARHLGEKSVLIAQGDDAHAGLTARASARGRGDRRAGSNGPDYVTAADGVDQRSRVS